MPFAGHPTVGTCSSLLQRGLLPSSSSALVQSCPKGLIPLRVNSKTNISLSSPPVFISSLVPLLPSLLCDGVNLPSDTPVVGDGGYISSCGLPFFYVRLENERDVEAASSSTTEVKKILDQLPSSVTGLYLYYVEQEETSLRVHARMFATDISEDPATGSACVGSVSPLLFCTRNARSF